MNLSVLVILLSLNLAAAFLSKIRTFLIGSKEKKSKTWQFVAESEVEYPGNNEEKIKIIQDMWNSYYNCLTWQYEDLGPYNSIMPEAIMMYEGSSVKLKCRACVRPDDMDRTDDVTWNYRTIPPTDTRIIELGEHKFLTPKDKALHMYDLTIQDTGQYFCQQGQTVTSAYFLEVVNSSEPTLEVHPEESHEGPYPQPPKNLPQFQIQIFTKWGNWSKCNTCGQVGRKIRYGICTIKQNIAAEVISNETNFKHPNLKSKTIKTFNLRTYAPKSAMTMHDIQNIKLRDIRTYKLKNVEEYPILNIFRDGLPCRSKLLPNSIKSISEVKVRSSEILIGLCKETCSGSEIFQVVDEKGNVLESANNSAGIYSTLQGIPREPPEIQRLTIFEDTLTKRIVLRCPGNLNTDAPIQWQIGSFNIDSVIVYILSQGRIVINVLDQIIIKEPKTIDSNIYSCWQNEQLAGTIRLIVTKKLELDLNQHVMLFGMIVILGTFVLVFFRAFRARNISTAF